MPEELKRPSPADKRPRYVQDQMPPELLAPATFYDVTTPKPERRQEPRAPMPAPSEPLPGAEGPRDPLPAPSAPLPTMPPPKKQK